MAKDTREYWSRHVRLWAASRLTLREYAAKAGVGASSLKNWKWQLGVEARRNAAPSFVEVASAVTAPSSDTFEVVLLDGVVVRVPSSFDGPTLRRLLEVVGGSR